MTHNVYARGPVPASHFSLDGGTNVCTAVLHALHDAFGGSAFDFDVNVVEAGPTSRSRGFVGVEATFTSSDDARSLRDALTAFGTDGEDEYGAWDFAFDVVDVD